MGYKYILFDLDGTLSDPLDGIYKSINYAMEKLGKPAVNKAEIAKFIGPPLRDGYVKNLGFDEETAVKAVEIYRERYSNIGLFENVLIDGAEELLKNLHKKGKIMAVATSKPEDMAVRLLEHFGLAKYFKFIGGAEWDTKGRNEKAEIIRYTLENLRIEQNEYKNCVMIGDRFYDIDGARKVGIDVIGVLVGFGSAEELKAADYIAEDLRAVEKFV